MKVTLSLFGPPTEYLVLKLIGALLGVLLLVSAASWTLTGDTPLSAYTKWQQRQAVEQFAEAATYGQHETVRQLLADTRMEGPQVELLSTMRTQGYLHTY